jgi:hypothetical protein
MHPARRLGAALGFATFFAFYFLPFKVAAGDPSWALTSADSLYGMAAEAVAGLATPRGIGLPAIAVLFGAVALVVGGAFGVNPKVGGTLDVVGMASASIGRSMMSSREGFALAAFGGGFWVLWATTAVTVCAAAWMWYGQRSREGKPSAKGWSK